jgi:putative membrane protein
MSEESAGPHAQTGEAPLSLTDELAVERTFMANERTLLAYIRTSLALLAAAITLLKFFTSNGMHMLGYILLPMGVGALVMGLMSHHDVRIRVHEMQAADQFRKKRAQSSAAEL